MKIKNFVSKEIYWDVSFNSQYHTITFSEVGYYFQNHTTTFFRACLHSQYHSITIPVSGIHFQYQTITFPASSRACLLLPATPARMRICRKPPSIMNGRNAIMSNVSCQPYINAMMSAVPMLAKFINNSPSRIPVVCKIKTNKIKNKL